MSGKCVTGERNEKDIEKLKKEIYKKMEDEKREINKRFDEYSTKIDVADLETKKDYFDLRGQIDKLTVSEAVKGVEIEKINQQLTELAKRFEEFNDRIPLFFDKGINDIKELIHSESDDKKDVKMMDTVLKNGVKVVGLILTFVGMYILGRHG